MTLLDEQIFELLSISSNNQIDTPRIGLSACHKESRLHGWHVKITVNLNEGAYFYIDYALYLRGTFAGYVFSTHISKKVNCYKTQNGTVYCSCRVG